MMSHRSQWGAEVVYAGFDLSDDPMIALSDGRVVFIDQDKVCNAHLDAGLLCATPHPSGVGLLSAGDDGRVVWSVPDHAPIELFSHSGAMIDNICVSQASQMVAYAAGKSVFVSDVNAKTLPMSLKHDHSVTALGFDPTGRKLFCASYNGVWVWYSRIQDQKPSVLKWPGSHTKLCVSPDGKYVMTAMQDNALHGWRLKDNKEMKMGGYPAKIRDMQFFYQGRLMATAGASGAVVWPFLKSSGPMGVEASEINPLSDGLVVRVCGAQESSLLAAGLEDGRVWMCALETGGIEWVKKEKSAPISALGFNEVASKLILGDEHGFVYIYEADEEELLPVSS